MHFVSDLMTRELTTLKETDNLGLAESAMKHLYLRHLPVVHEGRLVGLVTHRDLLRAAAQRGEKPAGVLTAREAMTRELQVVYPQTLLREALELMADNKFGCLPVVKSKTDSTLVGLVTESDLVKYALEVVRALDAEGRWGPPSQVRA